jgi:hypothetical protein
MHKPLDFRVRERKNSTSRFRRRLTARDEMEVKGVDRFHQSEDTDQWRGLVSTVIKIRVS